LGCLLCLLLANIPAFSQLSQEADSVQSNATLFRSCLSKLADSLVSVSPMLKGSSVLLSIVASEERPLIEQAITSGLKRNGCDVYLDSLKGMGVYLLKLNGVELHVTYREPFHERLFGESRSQRLVSASVPYMLSEAQTAKVLKSETLKLSLADTIAVGQISQLEQKNIQSTIAPMPERSFFDRLLEPLLIIGSTGVAIFLFFHIRS